VGQVRRPALYEYLFSKSVLKIKHRFKSESYSLAFETVFDYNTSLFETVCVASRAASYFKVLIHNLRSCTRVHAQPQSNWSASSNAMSPARLP